MAANHAAKRAQYGATNAAAYRRRGATPAGAARHKANSDAWREANRPQLNQAVAAWKRRNPDKHVAHQQARRARQAGAGGSYTVDDLALIFFDQECRCFYCPAPLTAYHVEHKTPLARGGSNGPENIALACPPCNLRKGARTEAEFRQGGAPSEK